MTLNFKAAAAEKKLTWSQIVLDPRSEVFHHVAYAYDAAGNLNYRTNNSLVQNFGVNNLNELMTVTRAGVTETAAQRRLAPSWSSSFSLFPSHRTPPRHAEA